MLTREGFAAKVATSGEDALTELRPGPPCAERFQNAGSPNQTTQPLVLKESTERDAWDRMGLREFASHIRTITVIGTRARLIVRWTPIDRGPPHMVACLSPSLDPDSGDKAALSDRCHKGP